MAEFSKLVITENGQALLAKMIAGSSGIEFTKVCASSAEYTEDKLEALTALSSIKQSSLISKITRTNDVAIQVETSFTNTELTAGYYMKALGLYASDPDDGEILYAATVETSGNCYMPAYNNVTVSGMYVKLVTTVGNAESVSLEVDEAAVATIGDVKELRSADSALVSVVKRLSVNGYDGTEMSIDTLVELSGGLSKKVQIGDDVYAYICEDGDCYVAGSGEIYTYTADTAPLRDYDIVNLYILNGIKSTEKYLLYYCTSLVSAFISDSITSIGTGAFYWCTKLTSITIPNSVTSIGSVAFRECQKLTSITIPNSVTSIGNGAFQHCVGLTSITIPDSVTSIAGTTFYNCNKLTSLSIPSTLTTLYSTALDKCTALSYITVRGDDGDTDVPYGVCDSSSGTAFTVDLNINELDSDVVFMVIFSTAASADAFKLTVNCNNGSTGSLYILENDEGSSNITTLSANTPYYFYADDVDNGDFYLTSL